MAADVCVIGGGMAGIAAAVAAARHGARVALIHDRPVLGGNASSEIRMWIRGASVNFPEYREGGIIEEIANRNRFYNPRLTYPLWDAVLYGIVKEEKNIALFLNCACIGAKEREGQVTEVRCRGLTNYTDYTIGAKFFIDCSGDCVLADYTAAETMRGREARDEYGESLAPAVRDDKTMGNSCLFQARETPFEIGYTPPPFAKKFTDGEFIHRMNIGNAHSWKGDNFWWLEIGGTRDTISDAEDIKDSLLAAAYGAWDYIKNSGRFDSANWELDFVSYIGAKRENRRYKGDYVLTQNDIDGAVKFEDEIGYGGWTMDDHDPLGMETRNPPNIHHPVKAPYGIPYRCLYSRNIGNLFFAGRNISATHFGLSSTRVMATCALMGQAAGTAAALCVKKKAPPRDLCAHIAELQQTLLYDDCFLLHTRRANGGLERKIGDTDEAAVLRIDEPFDRTFPARRVDTVRIVFDDDIACSYVSDYNERMYPNRCNTALNAAPAGMPPPLAKAFAVYGKENGVWKELFAAEGNYKRLVRVPCGRVLEGIQLVVRETFGAAPRVYAFEAV
ncbi:hypothetical protein FACS1894211_06000 [Clostridia bacterium]|nr:hypothetical protein FACS1894211_06000 [Clostridia bacterium]